MRLDIILGNGGGIMKIKRALLILFCFFVFPLTLIGCKYISCFNSKGNQSWAKNDSYHSLSMDRREIYVKNDIECSIINIDDEKIVLNLSLDKKSPQPSNTEIKIKAEGIGSNLLYEFNIFDGHNWKVLQEYSESNICTWKSSRTGDYRIRVNVKKSYSNKSNETYKELYFTIKDDIKVTSLTIDKKSPQTVNTNIKITAAANRSYDILYRFKVYDGHKYNIVQDYSKSNICNWKPNKSGSYRIRVDVLDSYSKDEFNSYKEVYFTIIDNLKITSITTDKASPQELNTTIKINAKASGSDSILYRFKIYDGTWKIVKDYSEVNVFNWTPTNPKSYRICVDIKGKNSSSSAISKEITFNIIKSDSSDNKEYEYKVFIDPGHGGYDVGSIGVSGIYEKIINLSIAKKVKSILQQYNIECLMSRSTDTYNNKYNIANMANESQCDVFVSIHANSFNVSSINGIETFYYASNYEGKKLAVLIHNSVLASTNANNRYVRADDFVVIRETKMASALVETGYLSNIAEEAKLRTEDYQLKVASGIASGILKYLKIIK